MRFQEKYTTEDLKKADMTGEEVKKSVISNDAYATSEMLQLFAQEISSKLDSIRRKF